MVGLGLGLGIDVLAIYKLQHNKLAISGNCMAH